MIGFLIGTVVLAAGLLVSAAVTAAYLAAADSGVIGMSPCLPIADSLLSFR